jgi:hypothetical protein
MNREKIDHPLLESLGYDRIGKILEIEFKRGGPVLKYFGMEPAETPDQYMRKIRKGEYSNARKIEANESEVSL